MITLCKWRGINKFRWERWDVIKRNENKDENTYENKNENRKMRRNEDRKKNRRIIGMKIKKR